jgi:photosystem II stability/assembly factor-like uncharacterized protein
LIPPEHLPRTAVNYTDGLRFSWPYLTGAVSPTNPDVLYVGNTWGYIFVTKDGARSWEEQRVRVDRNKFVGTIRPSNLGLNAGGRWQGVPREGVPSDVFSFDAKGKASTLGPNQARRSTLDDFVPFSSNTNGSRFERDFFNRGFERRGWIRGFGQGGGGGDARLGVGLRAGAKYLSLALRRKRGWAIGINIKQTLTLKAGAPTAVFWLSINPNNPNDVFAATRDGLLQTTDGGDSWPTVLTGATAQERTMSHVLRNPHDLDNLWVSSNSGMFISQDGGTTFSRITDARLAQYTCLWTTIHPKDPNRIYVGTTSGMFYSADGGNNFDWVWVQPWPAQNRVRRIAVDPVNLDRVLIATDDGLFVSDDVASEKWERSGGLQFTGLRVGVLESSGRPGHFLAGDTRDLWESFDGGKTWQVVYFGATRWNVRHAFFDPVTKDDIWLITSAEVLKLVRKPPDQLPPEAVAEFRDIMRREPTLSESIFRALKDNGLYRGDLTNYRRYQARYRGFAPKLRAGIFYRTLNVRGERDAIFARTAGGTEFGDIAYSTNRLTGLQWNVGLYWNLSTAVFSGDEAPFGRVFGITRKAERKIFTMVSNLYHERRRTQLAILSDPGADARTTLMRALSMEELTAHLNYLTGDLFPPFQALGGHQQ